MNKAGIGVMLSMQVGSAIAADDVVTLVCEFPEVSLRPGDDPFPYQKVTKKICSRPECQPFDVPGIEWTITESEYRAVSPDQALGLIINRADGYAILRHPEKDQPGRCTKVEKPNL